MERSAMYWLRKLGIVRSGAVKARSGGFALVDPEAGS